MDKYEVRRLALKSVIDQLGYGGIAQVARKIGVEPNYVSRLLYPPGKDGRKRIGEDKDDILANKYVAYLFAKKLGGAFDVGTYTGTDSPVEEKFEPHEPTGDSHALIQQLDLQASCGNGKFHDHVVVKGGLAFKHSTLRSFGVPEDRARIIYANGHSMEPTIYDGRVVLINLDETMLIDNKIFLICDSDGAIYLKRVVREYHAHSGGMTWIMRSDNPNKKDFPDKLFPQDDRTHIIGRAVWNDNLL